MTTPITVASVERSVQMLCRSRAARRWTTAWGLTLGLVLVGGSRVDAGQDAGVSGAYTAPRTPDGQPDLQGF